MKRISILMLAVLTLVLGAGSFAFAEDGLPDMGDTVKDVRDVEVAKEAEDSVHDTSNEVRDAAHAIREAAKETAEQHRETAVQKRDDIKERVAQKKAELDVTKCERNQTAIVKLLPQLATGATRQVTILDTMYDRVVSFYEKSNLRISSDQYKTLVQAVENAKTSTHSSVDALTQSEVTVDCNARGIGTQLGEYRAAVSDTKTELKQYRVALVQLIKAIKAAAQEPKSADTTTTEQSSSEQTRVDTTGGTN